MPTKPENDLTGAIRHIRECKKHFPTLVSADAATVAEACEKLIAFAKSVREYILIESNPNDPEAMADLGSRMLEIYEQFPGVLDGE